MRRYEVFDPVTDRLVCAVPFAWLAAGICRLFRSQHFFDWAKAGEGWPLEEEER